MVELLGVSVPLPKPLEFLGTRWWSFGLSVLLAVLLGAIAYPLAIRALRRWTRRTPSEIDDLLVALSRRPFLLALSVVAAILSWHCLHLYQEVQFVDRALIAMLVGITAYWLHRVFTRLVMFKAQKFAERSETNVDDVLVPIATQMGPIVIYAVGGAFVLQALGVSIPLIVAGIGGGSFIAGLALQDSLSNMFAGISLLVDTPFKYGDLVVLGDGTICEVKRIGLRVTQLYGVSNHSVIYMPNKDLANQQLVNITRPSPDLIVKFNLGVSYSSDVPLVREILRDVLLSHPDILGTPSEKSERLKKRRATVPSTVEHLANKLDRGIARLEAEEKLDGTVRAIRLSLCNLAGWVSDTQTAEGAEGRVVEILDRLRKIDESIQGPSLDEASLRSRMRAWVQEVCADPDLSDFPDDRTRIERNANRSLDHLVRRLNRLMVGLGGETPATEGLAERILDFDAWIGENLRSEVPSWKNPDVNFVAFGESSLDFEVEFFIDDINLEHFERQDRVLTEVREEILTRFRAQGVEMPFPQRDLWFRSPLDARLVSPSSSEER